jgi:ribosomal protein S18 acetylase RimI-like enzyme
MTTDIEIELAGELDWKRVRALRLAALQDAPDAFASNFDRESVQSSEWWRGRLRSESATTLLAVNGEDAGMAVVATEAEKTEAWLYGVWVAPAHRGQRVGDALMVAAIKHARTMEVRRLMLEVAETNIPAQTLYLRHGFVKTGRLSSLPAPREHKIEVEFALNLS